MQTRIETIKHLGYTLQMWRVANLGFAVAIFDETGYLIDQVTAKDRSFVRALSLVEAYASLEEIE